MLTRLFRLIAAFAIVFPLCSSAQWAPSGNDIVSSCPTAPCKVVVNPTTPTTSAIAFDIYGSMVMRGAGPFILLSGSSTSTGVAIDAPTSQIAHIMLRSNGVESVFLRREPTTNDFTIFTAPATGASPVERMRIRANGYLGIGTASPSQPLEVNGNVRSTPSTGSFSVGGAAPATGYPFYATSATASIPTAVQLRSNYSGFATSFIGNFGNYGTWLSQNRDPQTNIYVDGAASSPQNAVSLSIGDSMRGRLFNLANYPGGTENVRMMVDYNGQVLIGTTTSMAGKVLHVVGDTYFEGEVRGTKIRAQYQDVAEWVPSADDLAPGTVVVVDKRTGNTVRASMTAYDTSVAGVVSGDPGIILGEESASKEQVATTGRVRVRVDASKGAIQPGDLLVTSDVPGTAMKSAPVDIGGISMHRPGTIIGKALEPMDAGVGEILVLLSLQ